MAIRTLSVCSGIGGMDLGLRLADPQVRTVCYVEREAFAAATLVARMEDKTLDTAPIWDCLHTFPWWLFVGRVDLVAATIPCVGWSFAGLGKGFDDPRDLWSRLLYLLEQLGRPALYLENAQGFRKALPEVLKALALLGYSAEWTVLSCEDLGDSQERKRFLLLAYTDRFKLRFQQGRGSRQGGSGETQLGEVGPEVEDPSNSRLQGGDGCEPGESRPTSPSPELAYPTCGGTEWGRGLSEGWEHNLEPSLYSQKLAHPHGHLQGGLSLREGSQDTNTRECGQVAYPELPFWPPGQSVESWEREGWPECFWPSSERTVCGATDGLPDWLVKSDAYRTDRLRALGNAFSPPVAAVGWRVLTERMMR